MNEWQPIETAPRDGTRFLGYFPPVAGSEFNDSMVTTWFEPDGWYTPYDGGDLGAYDAPTHWMPHPEAPK